MKIIDEAVVDQYVNMGDWLQKIGESESYTIFMQEYNFSVRHIKKPVPIAWYLKNILISICIRYILFNFRENEKNSLEVKKRLSRYLKDRGYSYGDISTQDALELTDEYTVGKLREKLVHFFNFTNPKIREAIEGYDYGKKPPHVVFADLEELVDSLIDPNESFYVSESEEREVLGDLFEDYLEFDDGWKWIRKHVYKDDLESKYGGHCGTCSSDDEEFLSLREPVPDNPDKWKIWATFSINSDNYLVQRKGVVEEYKEGTTTIKRRNGNRRPEPHLFPYIYGLLKYGTETGDIVGFNGSQSYNPSQDFELTDLPISQRKELEGKLEVIREFDTMYEEYEYFGEITDGMLYRINDRCSVDVDKESNTFININLNTVDENYIYDIINSIFDEVPMIKNFRNFSDDIEEILPLDDEDDEEDISELLDWLNENDFAQFLNLIYPEIHKDVFLSMFDSYFLTFEDFVNDNIQNFYKFVRVLREIFEGFKDNYKVIAECAFESFIENYDDIYNGIYINKIDDETFKIAADDISIVSAYDNLGYSRRVHPEVSFLRTIIYDSEGLSQKVIEEIENSFSKIFAKRYLNTTLVSQHNYRKDQYEFDELG